MQRRWPRWHSKFPSLPTLLQALKGEASPPHITSWNCWALPLGWLVRYFDRKIFSCGAIAIDVGGVGASRSTVLRITTDEVLTASKGNHLHLDIHAPICHIVMPLQFSARCTLARASWTMPNHLSSAVQPAVTRRYRSLASYQPHISCEPDCLNGTSLLIVA